MRWMVRSAITYAWAGCSNHPSVRLPDVVIDITGEDLTLIKWRVSHESSYWEYLAALLTTTSLGVASITGFLYTQDYLRLSCLTPVKMLGGRGNSMIVRLEHSRDIFYVYKGLTYSSFLEHGGNFNTKEIRFITK